ncbi:MAG: 8-amino-7-oxononanoate synthase [Maricaulaceae bacterium]
MKSLEKFVLDKLDALEAVSLRRRLHPTRPLDGAWVERSGRRLLSFASNDYLGLARHPRVLAASQAALATYGAGATASRLVVGDYPLLRELETELARWKGYDAAAVFGAGYLANAGVTPCFAKPGDAVFIDALAHACLWAGAQLSGAAIHPFRHNDVDHLNHLLRAHRARARHALVLTDGVFSMDGDRAPLDGLFAVCTDHDAWLMVDDAHGLGVLAQGRGTAALFADAPVPLATGTLSKALGGYGGYVCASEPIIEFIRNRARPFVYSTGLPPASAAAALEGLRIIAEEPKRCARPLALARRFTDALGLPTAQSPIVPVVLGAPEAALAAQATLEAQSFLVVAIRPPTVAEGTARLRIAFSAAHAEADVDRLARAINPILERSVP